MTEIPPELVAEFADLARTLAAVDDVVLEVLDRYETAAAAVLALDGVRDDAGDLDPDVLDDAGETRVSVQLAVLVGRLADVAGGEAAPEELERFGIPDRGYTEAFERHHAQFLEDYARMVRGEQARARVRDLEDRVFELTTAGLDEPPAPES